MQLLQSIAGAPGLPTWRLLVFGHRECLGRATGGHRFSGRPGKSGSMCLLFGGRCWVVMLCGLFLVLLKQGWFYYCFMFVLGFSASLHNMIFVCCFFLNEGGCCFQSHYATSMVEQSYMMAGGFGTNKLMNPNFSSKQNLFDDWCWGS